MLKVPSLNSEQNQGKSVSCLLLWCFFDSQQNVFLRKSFCQPSGWETRNIPLNHPQIIYLNRKLITKGVYTECYVSKIMSTKCWEKERHLTARTISKDCTTQLRFVFDLVVGTPEASGAQGSVLAVNPCWEQRGISASQTFTKAAFMKCRNYSCNVSLSHPYSDKRPGHTNYQNHCLLFWTLSICASQ